MVSKGLNTVADHDTGNIYRLYNWMELQHMYLDTIPAYVYYIKHIPTGKYYYGFRSANIALNRLPKDDLWKKYFTSSKEVKDLRKTADNFYVEIIHEDTDLENAFWVEQDYIKQHIDDPLCLNKYYQDKNSNNRVFSFAGQRHSEETREILKSKTPWNLGKSMPRDYPSWNKGIPTPESVKALIRERTTGIRKSEDTKQRMRKPKSKTHRENISKAAKERPKFPCEICGRLITKANITNHRNSHENG